MAAVDATTSLPLVATPGRELAARALQAGPDCSQQRISDLLGVSRRTIGRMVDADLSTALRDPQVLEVARTCLAETTGRGCTSEERAAALAWLQEAAQDEHQAARDEHEHQAERAPAASRPSRRAAARRPARRHARRPSHNGAHRTGATTPTAGIPDPPAPAPLTHVEALRRQQQRILHRSALVNYVLAAERRTGAPLTMGDALADLLADITEAARTIGTLLQAAAAEPARTDRPIVATSGPEKKI